MIAVEYDNVNFLYFQMKSYLPNRGFADSCWFICLADFFLLR